MVSRQDEHHLPEIVKEYEVLLSQLVIFMFCYATEHNLYNVHTVPKRARMVLYQP